MQLSSFDETHVEFLHENASNVFANLLQIGVPEINYMILMLNSKLLFNTGAHLGILEGRGPNFKKGSNLYKTKKKQIVMVKVIYWRYIANFLIKATKLGKHMILDKKNFQGNKTN